MSDDVARALKARGERVRVSVATPQDVEPYRVAMRRSAARIGRWNPVNPGDLVHHLAAQSDKHRTFLIRALDDVRAPDDDAGLVGCVNVTNVVHGRFMSATMGYNAFDPYVGAGLFREGLSLVVDIALRPAPAGMGLHRVEADVRTGNAVSAGVLRSLGFRRERSIRRMLWLADGVSGPSAWRDHDSYAVTREEWPAQPYAEHDQPTGVLVFDASVPEPDAVALARELGACAVFGVTYEAGLQLATFSGVPVVWCAGDDASRAVGELDSRGVAARLVTSDDVDRIIPGRVRDAAAISRLALALRSSLG